MDVFAFFELFVPMFAIFGNLIALDAVIKGDIPLAGFRRFLISLLASDLYICVVKILLALVEKMAHSYYELNMQVHKCVGEIGRSLEITGFIAYLLNLCGMFVDHYIALLHAHKYKYLMDKRLARIAVFLIWPAAFMIGFIDHPVRAFAHWLLRSNDGSLEASSSSGGSFLTSAGSPSNLPNCSSDSITTANNLVTSNPTFLSTLTWASSTATDYYDSSGETEQFDPFAPGEDFGSNPCRSDDLNNTFGLLEIVRKGLDFDGNNYRRNLVLCASFDRTSKLWLDWIVVILGIGAAFFLGMCYTFFRQACERAGRAKGKLQKLTITTFLLLGAFILCWMPYICYELFMELIFQTNQGLLTANSSQTFFVVHNGLHMLFIFTPLLVPIIYVTRLRVVQRHIVERYAFLLPAFVKRKLEKSATQTRQSSMGETTSVIHGMSIAEATMTATHHSSIGCGLAGGVGDVECGNNNNNPPQLPSNNSTCNIEVEEASTEKDPLQQQQHT